MQETHIATLNTLVHALELRDETIKAHSEWVAFYAVKLAETLGLQPQKITEIKMAIGMMGNPNQILRKPGKLNEAE